ncbi:MAG: A/G-specific adenine glycosylase [Spirochaetia bacterium]|jgi:A/G-specific adenine glycosylase
MPWRETRSPYRILVSEFMLQQTGIGRVANMYGPFLRHFPSFAALARASVAEVVAAWKGLGYNRRALALRQTAALVVERHHGRLPKSLEELRALPGIGPATAGALLAYCFDIPVPFIETNIRRSFIHFFFRGELNIPDARLLPLVVEALDRENPREWYYALMDYGTMLARKGENPNRRSSAYKRQAAFEGSMRQLRGRILEIMLELRCATAAQIAAAVGREEPRLSEALGKLAAEGFLERKGGRFYFR